MKKILSLFLIFILSFGLSSCFDDDSLPSSNNSTYEISNDFFTFVRFIPRTQTNVDFVNGTQTQISLIAVEARVSYEIIEVSMIARLYCANNTLLDTITATQERRIQVNSTFSLSDEVTARTQADTARVAAIFSGLSRTQPQTTPASTFTVTFFRNNGQANIIQNVTSGQTITRPAAPTKTNHIFIGWSTSNNTFEAFGFDTPITSNITLFAHFSVDYASIINLITTQIMRSNIRVTRESYNTFLGFRVDIIRGFGSGIIFYACDQRGYWALTNNHVTVRDSSRSRVRHYIQDYRGNSIRGNVVHECPNFDLAVVHFRRPGNATLSAVQRASINPEVGDSIVSLGQPCGQNNAITFGRVNRYRHVNMPNVPTYRINVNFPVIAHSAEIAPGSSGGAVLDMNLRLVGINFARSWFVSTGEFAEGLTIPIEKVNEFLNRYIWA